MHLFLLTINTSKLISSFFIYLLIYFRNLGHNGLTGQIPNQIGKLAKLESLNLNYNSLNGQFPSIDAPPTLGYCYMTPNQFQSCPDDSVIQNPQSLAYQCSVDCLVKNTKKKSSGLTINNPPSNFVLLLSVVFLYITTARFN
jgi:hypothetical protein